MGFQPAGPFLIPAPRAVLMSAGTHPFGVVHVGPANEPTKLTGIYLFAGISSISGFNALHIWTRISTTTYSSSTSPIMGCFQSFGQELLFCNLLLVSNLNYFLYCTSYSLLDTYGRNIPFAKQSMGLLIS